MYFNNQSDKGGKISGIFKALQDNFFKENDTDAHKLSQNDNQAHYYVLVNGKIDSTDVQVLKGTMELKYGAIDMSLLNAHYVDKNGKPNYGHFVLQGLRNLKSIALPRDMDCIGNDCLADCSSLTKIIIPDGVKSIGDEAFRECFNITSLNIPEGCTTIGRSAFVSTRLQAVKLPSTLESIGKEAFENNKDLATITFPTPAKGVTLTLGYHVFNGCDNLRDIYITDVAPIIGTDQRDETFWPDQLGVNVNRSDLKDGEVTFDNYKDSKPIFLHYPQGKGKEYGDISEKDCRKAKYSYEGKEGYKQKNGYMDKYPKNQETSNWCNDPSHTGWAKFAFASEYEGTPIDVPKQYEEGRWYTMCFPFNLTRKQIEDTFGSGTEVCNFQYVEKEQIGEMTVYSIRFNEDLIKNGLDKNGDPITPGSKIITYADKPYMIHPSQKPSNGQYQITDGDRWEYKYKEENGQSEKTDQLISFDVTNKNPGSTKGDISDATVTSPAHVDAVFQGNYKKQLIPFGVFFLASNEYYKIEASKDQSRTKGYLNPYTAYVEIKDADFKADKYIADLKEYSKVMPKDASVGKAKIIFPSLWGEDDMSNSTTTAILPVHVASKPVDMENARIYNLQGQLVGIGADTLKTLHNGIYVMNGKKYVIR